MQHNTWNWTTFFHRTEYLPTMNYPSVSALCHDLLTQSFENGLQMILASVPAFDHEQWQAFYNHIHRHCGQHPHADTWLLIANLFYKWLDTSWQLANHDVEQAITLTRRKLAKLNRVEQFAWMATLFYHAQTHVKARMMFDFLLPEMDPDADQMPKLKVFYEELPPRRQEVARLAAQGYTNNEIASALYIQPSVVSEHLAAIFPAFEAAMQIEFERNGRRYRLIHWLTRLFERHPHLLF